MGETQVEMQTQPYKKVHPLYPLASGIMGERKERKEYKYQIRLIGRSSYSNNSTLLKSNW